MIRYIKKKILSKVAMIIRRNDQLGAVTLFMTLILLLLSTMIIIFAANYGTLQDKSTSNIKRNIQAYEAGEAGLEFGMNYLNKNSTSILSNPVNGYIQTFTNGSTTNVSLANNSKYTITFTNPVAYNYKLIKITSTGTSDDGTATRTISQLVQFGSLLLNPPTIPLYSKGGVILNDNSEVINQTNNYTIKSASSVQLNNSGETILNSGVSSTSALLKSDVIQNDATLLAMSSGDLFANLFGTPQSVLQTEVGSLYSNNVNTSYKAKLNGITGTSVFIDQTAGLATINGFSFIGTSSNPVLLVVNGNTQFTGFVIMYGFLYVNGTITLASGSEFQLTGGMAGTGSLSGPGVIIINYSPTVLTTLQTQPGMQYYAKVPGSWKDF